MYLNENTLRINYLHKFIELYKQYLQTPTPEIRNQICKDLGALSFYARGSGINTYTNLPSRGNVDLFANIFDQDLANPRKVVDRIYNAIGNYELLQREWKRKIVNPLYWFSSLIRLPFIVLRYSGVNISNLEKSALSKTYKIFMSFFLNISALVGLLAYFGITFEVVLSFFGFHK